MKIFRGKLVLNTVSDNEGKIVKLKSWNILFGDGLKMAAYSLGVFDKSYYVALITYVEII